MWRIFIEDLVRTGQLGHRMMVVRENFDGSAEVLQTSTLKHYEPHSFIPTEDAFLDDSRMPGVTVRAVLQAMSDAAWELGIKPKQIEDNSNELKATKYHLEDMRKLVLK